MPYDPYAQFLEVMNDLASARRECRHLLNLFEWEQERYGDLSIRIKDRVGGLPAIEVMIEASFRLMKWVQHGDYANQRDASNLWLTAVRNFVSMTDGTATPVLEVRDREALDRLSEGR